MKKILLVATLTMCFISVSHAQVSFGLKGGVTGYYFTGKDNDGDFGMKVGGFGGIFTRIAISENFSIQPEAVFSMEGARTKGPTMDGVPRENFKLRYINVPIMFQYHTPTLFYIEAGPQIGLLVGAKRKYEGEIGSGTEDVKHKLRNASFGAAFGFGYEFPTRLGLAARFNLGITEIENDANIYRSNFKTSGFQLGLTYSFGGAE